MGTWQYRYNAFGELTWQQDAKGQVTQQEYDALGRMVQRTTPDDTANWVYDTAPYGKGKLAAESNNDSDTRYAYDKLGRPIATTREIGSETYVSKLGYDPYSRPAVEVYPDGVQINRHYSSTGHLQRITTPKKNVWDYAYLELEQALDAMADALLKLHAQANTAQNKYLATIREADRIRRSADAIEAQSQAASREVATLREWANYLQTLADIHQRDAANFRDFATQMWQRYGDLMWSYRYATDFGGVYTSNKCLDKGLFNHCNYKPSVEIQRLLLESDCVDNPTEYKGVARCTYGVPNSLNLTHFFNGRAQWLENIAATERQWAQQNRDGAAAAEIRANTLHQQALAAKALAEQTYARAKNEYAILKQIVDKITDYSNASAELQQAIAAHHADESEIPLWAATRYDAASPPGLRKARFCH